MALILKLIIYCHMDIEGQAQWKSHLQAQPKQHEQWVIHNLNIDSVRGVSSCSFPRGRFVLQGLVNESDG